MAQPNLLFIYTDQQRSDSLAAYGNDPDAELEQAG